MDCVSPKDTHIRDRLSEVQVRVQAHAEIPGSRGNNYLIIGERGTGVSILACKIATQHSHLDLESETKIVYFSAVDNPNISSVRYPLSALGDLLAQPPVPHHTIIIIDDSLAYEKSFASREFCELILNGRHKNFTVILCLQYVMHLQPTIRRNFDHVLLLKRETVNQSDLKRFFEHYCGLTYKYEHLVNIMTRINRFDALHAANGELSVLQKYFEGDVHTLQLQPLIINQNAQNTIIQRVRDNNAKIVALQQENDDLLSQLPA